MLILIIQGLPLHNRKINDDLSYMISEIQALLLMLNNFFENTNASIHQATIASRTEEPSQNPIFGKL